MDIISKRDGPRREDAAAREHLRRNWGKIEQLADQLSGGSYSASKARKPDPKAKGLIFVDQSARRLTGEPTPYLRISQNGRVVVADSGSGVQLHFLGELRRKNGALRFVAATAANGFISPLEDALYGLIRDLEGQAVNRDFTEDDLASALKLRLKIV